MYSRISTDNDEKNYKSFQQATKRLLVGDETIDFSQATNDIFSWRRTGSVGETTCYTANYSILGQYNLVCVFHMKSSHLYIHIILFLPNMAHEGSTSRSTLLCNAMSQWRLSVVKKEKCTLSCAPDKTRVSFMHKPSTI